MDIRRIQMTGGSSFVVTLPREWIAASNLRKNDPVRVTAQSDGTLRISANLSDDQVSRVRTIDAGSCTSAVFLFRSLIGTYIAGYTEIVICSSSPLSSFARAVVRDFTRMTIGQEVMEETDTMIRVKDLLDPSEMPFEKTLNRMFGIARAMHEDAIRVVEEMDRQLALAVIEEDRNVDRLQWLIARQANMGMRDTRLLRRSGLSPVEIVNHAIVARIVERIADHAVKIATNAAALADHPIDPGVGARLHVASAFSLEVFDLAARSFLSHETGLANQVIEDVRRAEAFCEDLHAHALSMPAGPAVALGNIAESIRRLAEYSGDIAETVINDVVEKGG